MKIFKMNTTSHKENNTKKWENNQKVQDALKKSVDNVFDT